MSISYPSCKLGQSVMVNRLTNCSHPKAFRWETWRIEYVSFKYTNELFHNQYYRIANYLQLKPLVKNNVLIAQLIIEVMQLQHPEFHRITINPEVCFGKPCIRGMRFPVSTLLGYLASGATITSLLEDFPFLEVNDIYEALAFASKALEDNYITLQSAAA